MRDDGQRQAASTRLWARRSNRGRAGAGAMAGGGGRMAIRPHPPCSIHVVTSENRALYERELEASFRLRHQVYVTERHWDEFRSPDHREMDQYDNAGAIYLLAIEDGSRRLVGGARLVSTVNAPVLGEFKSLAGGYPLPRSPFVFHLSRTIVVADRRENSSLNMVAATILCGIQEYCLAEDIEQLTLLSRMSVLPLFLELGWNPQPLAIPEVLWAASCVVATLDVSETALQRTREVRDIAGSVLVRRGITLPATPPRPVSDRLC
ncbi:MAG: GNAT family N-acetyltransferase [Hyphomicrobiaceae bacterium]|nr:GNAT family N-acetyltransferase [Hyphomicrobiaceae bacterium]